MNLPKSLLLVLSFLVFGCAAGSGPGEPDNRATLKIQGMLQRQYTNNLVLKVASIDGVKAKAVDNLRKTHRLAPGRRTIKVAGDFQRARTSVTFTFEARPRETYSLTGRFELLSNGGIRHYYHLQDGRGRVLQKKSATTRF